MKYPRRFAATLTLTVAVSLAAFGQAPDPPAGRAEPNTPLALAAELHPPRRRSIVHHYPHPYPEYYHGDQTAGFRNPGGVGRYIEYYPPGDKFQENNDPVQAARFDTGFGNRSEQIQAQQVGIQRENAIMNNIDRMAAPRLGVGYFGGFN